MTRTADEDLAPQVRGSAWKGLDLTRRSNRANEFNAAAFVSVHANANARAAAHGAWVLHDDNTVRGVELARAIFRQLARIPGVPDTDPAEEVYPDDSPWTGGRDIHVLGATKMPAVLVELGFLTNPEDRADLAKPATREAITRAIASGIECWLAAG